MVPIGTKSEDEAPRQHDPLLSAFTTRPPAAPPAHHPEAAFAALMEKGYARTSTLEIATRARVSKRELYAEFGSKSASSRL